MAKYTENDLQAAISAVQNGCPIRKAARDYGIPRTTLGDRLKGAESRKDANSYKMRLSIDQEAKLAKWALIQGQLGLPLSHAQIRDFAGRILHAGGDSQPLGKHWMQHFLQRNPEVKTLPSKRMDSKRANAASAEEIQAWFDRIKAILEIQGILGEDTWNMDESGIMEGLGINGLVVGSSSLKRILSKTLIERIWTSFIECISANGSFLHPLVIFSGKTV